ncbi:hypothetical protein PoB_003614900 [Plakobranchus ocellatus]|uniref:Uncharacterized protein n=1 Tax=Plakobranchus ocellatus TaxID=259542 RepID=A0AAV4AU55_9GAST|nr:hypothetical protein PoB_003614900 [Plakobranchus ocellatus]
MLWRIPQQLDVCLCQDIHSKSSSYAKSDKGPVISETPARHHYVFDTKISSDPLKPSSEQIRSYAGSSYSRGFGLVFCVFGLSTTRCLRLQGSPSGQGYGGGARTPYRKVPTDFKVELLKSMPPILQSREKG